MSAKLSPEAGRRDSFACLDFGDSLQHPGFVIRIERHWWPVVVLDDRQSRPFGEPHARLDGPAYHAPLRYFHTRGSLPDDRRGVDALAMPTYAPRWFGRGREGDVPCDLRTAAGLKVGDIVEAVPHRQGVLLKAKALVDKDIDDVRAAYLGARSGRLSGPFDTAGELIAHLHRQRRRSRKWRSRRMEIRPARTDTEIAPGGAARRAP
jgi:hypothetical protein